MDELDKFRFINSINFTKKNLSEDPLLERDYNAYFINKALSYHEDSFVAAEFMNLNGDVPKKCQYLFMLNAVPKAKRFAKFIRKKYETGKEKEHLELVQSYFQYNVKKALAVLDLLSDEQIAMIKVKQFKGDYKKKK